MRMARYVTQITKRSDTTLFAVEGIAVPGAITNSWLLGCGSPTIAYWRSPSWSWTTTLNFVYSA
jgi:hypothetical protein